MCFLRECFVHVFLWNLHAIWQISMHETCVYCCNAHGLYCSQAVWNRMAERMHGWRKFLNRCSQTHTQLMKMFNLMQSNGYKWMQSNRWTAAGLQIISWLAPVKLSGQTYFCSDISHFWPDKHRLRLIAIKVPPHPFTWCIFSPQGENVSGIGDRISRNFEPCIYQALGLHSDDRFWYRVVAMTLK